MVGMAVDPTTGGYDLATSDRGVFAFRPPFLGSEGGVRLVRPVFAIGIQT